MGQKRVVVTEEGGQLRILREEMLDSDLRPEPLPAAQAAQVAAVP